MANVQFKSYAPTLLEIEPKCLVHFRPHGNYNGEFGFDWVRLGDSGSKGDVWYKNITGYYDTPKLANGDYDYCNPKFVQSTKEYDNMVFGEYRRFSVPWKTINKDAPYIYPIPYMTLLPEYSAKLKLIVEVEEEPEKFEFKYNEEYFEVTVDKGFPVTKGISKIDSAITIKCKAYFERDEFIEVYALKGSEQYLAGQLIVKRNHTKFHHFVKICFVNVIMGKNKSNMNLANEKAALRKYLRQAYIKAEIKSETIVLSGEKEIRAALDNYSSDPKESVFYILEKSLYEQRQKNYLASKYNTYRKVYLTPMIIESNSCGRKGYLLGRSQDIPSKKGSERPSVIIADIVKTNKKLKTSPSTDEATVAHEIFHSMGLQHTFVNGSKYVFKEYETDNIMDYYGKKTAIKSKQLYKWQWEQLWALL
ncbi:hypothetical protein ACTJKN_27205 [Pedobacter sp. 22163]|uniref:hypothetical protein n=1 Tax=Pedobacter sp. 22163 TaxID=3453883 RepID=UPI003F85199A